MDESREPAAEHQVVRVVPTDGGDVHAEIPFGDGLKELLLRRGRRAVAPAGGDDPLQRLSRGMGGVELFVHVVEQALAALHVSGASSPCKFIGDEVAEKRAVVLSFAARLRAVFVGDALVVGMEHVREIEPARDAVLRSDAEVRIFPPRAPLQRTVGVEPIRIPKAHRLGRSFLEEPVVVRVAADDVEAPVPQPRERVGRPCRRRAVLLQAAQPVGRLDFPCVRISGVEHHVGDAVRNELRPVGPHAPPDSVRVTRDGVESLLGE